jgi:AcrR family transcriptional regulator
MADVDHPTRARLVDAGLALADQGSLGSVSIDEIVRAAGVAKGTFYVHFATRDEFLCALYDRFHQRLLTCVGRATSDCQPGAERLRRACEAYFDSCLDAAGVKSMIAGARGEPALEGRIAAADRELAEACAADFEATGWARPHHTAQLLVAAAAEVVRSEQSTGRQEPLRAALWDVFQLGAGG